MRMQVAWFIKTEFMPGRVVKELSCFFSSRPYQSKRSFGGQMQCLCFLRVCSTPTLSQIAVVGGKTFIHRLSTVLT